ncbi:unnamed protein product [Rotaria sp. Silwood2]|nr:unnamed protein product [Rotaria sp. Silwood2]CAF3998160.1 unnamed protein product [Rotaria sp. Silwood2]
MAFSGTTFGFSNSETVYGVWNTTAGGDSIPSSSGTSIGNYYPTEIPSYACDNNINSKYTNFGTCTSASSAMTCGVNTGFYVTPQQGPLLVIGLKICTSSNLSARDPMTITFEGSNQPASALHIGSSWTLLYNGSSGLSTDPGRLTCGVSQLFNNNSIWYASYRFLVTSKRGADASTWYSEVIFIT